MFLTKLFTAAQRKKQFKGPSVDAQYIEWNDSAINKNKVLTPATTWMNHEDTVQ